jgi:tetratricopeptide (TPR) repeat protein
LFIAGVVFLFYVIRQMLRNRRPPVEETTESVDSEAEFDEAELDELELEDEDLPTGMRRGTGWVVENPSTLNNIKDMERNRLFARGLAMRSQGHFDEAERVFYSYLGQDRVTSREEAAILIALGNSFFIQGKMEQAAGFYREAEEIARKDITEA